MTKRQPIPFGKYLLLDRVNIGGMAEVWKAKTFGAEGFEKLVAIKRILPNIAEDKDFIEMFIDEAKISVHLTHANIAQVFDLGKIGDSYYIAMEYVSGRDLRAIFDKARKRGEPAPIPLTCYVLAKAAEGLDYAHRKRDTAGNELNIVHRDVSPQNILCSFDGETKVIDFGIAKAANKATKTQAGILKGKFGYMSPEQVRGLPLDRRSDVFALGVVLYEMLTGERLFVGESDFSVLEKVRAVDILPPTTYNRRIPPALEKIVLRSLAKDVEDRFQYASELGDELQRFLITNDTIFSRKDLMQFMKSTFAEDVEREKIKLQEYAEIKLPPGMAIAAGLAPMASPSVPVPAPTNPPSPARPLSNTLTVAQPNMFGAGATAVVPPPQSESGASDTTQIGGLDESGAPQPPERRPPPPRPAAPALAPTLTPRPPPGSPPVLSAKPGGAPPVLGPRITGTQPLVSTTVGRVATNSAAPALRPATPGRPLPAPVAEPDEPNTLDELGSSDDGDDATRGWDPPTHDTADEDEPVAPRSGGSTKWLAICGVVLALGLVATAGLVLLNRSRGSLLVNCDPSDNLVVLVDGELVGNQTPKVIEGLSSGPHTLEVTAKGYAILDEKFEISANQRLVSMQLKLKPLGAAPDPGVAAPSEGTKPGATGTVLAVVTADQIGAEVSLDGKVVIAKDAKEPIFTGQVDAQSAHLIEAKLEGYKPFSRTIPAGEPVKVVAHLERADAK